MATSTILTLAAVVAAIAASQGIEVLINRVFRPNAMELTWISDVVLSAAVIAVTGLWLRLRQARTALSVLEHERVVVETQLSAAAAVQNALLPAIPDPIAGIHWHAAIEPAGKVGGDYYDFMPLADGRMCVILADVSGKGIPAAVFLSNVRAILHAVLRETSEPAEIIRRLSETLIADASSGLYATCLVAVIDPDGRVMRYANAGHPAGLAWGRPEAIALDKGGPPAGLLPGAHYDEGALTLREGDLVVFVSDGVTEAIDARGVDVPTALAAELARAAVRTPEAVCARLLEAARQGPGPAGAEEWSDDRTVVAFGIPRP